MEYLIIDPSTRKITIPKSEQLFGVYGEGNIERKYFKCPKIVGDNRGICKCYFACFRQSRIYSRNNPT